MQQKAYRAQQVRKKDELKSARSSLAQNIKIEHYCMHADNAQRSKERLSFITCVKSC